MKRNVVSVYWRIDRISWWRIRKGRVIPEGRNGIKNGKETGKREKLVSWTKYRYVYSSNGHGLQTLERTKMTFNRQKDKEDVVHIHNGVLCLHQKGWIPNFYFNMDGTRRDYAEWNKSSRGTWVAQWVKPLPSAQVMISGSWGQAPHRALCSAGSLLPPLSLPASLPACALCLSNKWIKS